MFHFLFLCEQQKREMREQRYRKSCEASCSNRNRVRHGEQKQEQAAHKVYMIDAKLLTGTESID